MAQGVLPLVPLGGLVFLWGCLRPLYHTAIHQAIDDADRTTLVSAENLLANLLEAVVRTRHITLPANTISNQAPRVCGRWQEFVSRRGDSGG